MKARRLDQILSSLGYCSRSSARDFLRQQTVTLDGRRLSQPSEKIDATHLLIDGEPVDHPEGLIVLLNKPAGYVCSHDAREGPSVFELLPPRWLQRNPRIESVGRLDKDTTGTLLLTDDGQLNHRWTSPHHHMEKVYTVDLDLPFDDDLAAAFAVGDLLLSGEDKPCRPARLERLGPSKARLILVEGRFHQVKRMFAHFGLTVTALHRTAFGPYCADDLPSGHWRQVEVID